MKLIAVAWMAASVAAFGGVAAPAAGGDDIVTTATKSDLLHCDDAGPQSPRDVSAGQPHAIEQTPMKSLDGLVHVNTHFHLGAEHKSEGQYDVPYESTLGFKCNPNAVTAEDKHLQPYEFQYCKHVEVGGTYEFHWVYSSGGEKLGAGLGGAFATTSTPSIIVQGQTFFVVNDDSGAYDTDLLDGHTFKSMGKDFAMYVGSTTGTKYNNDNSCSPYLINWHVDRKCHLVSAKSMDEVCRLKKEKGMDDDTHPHGSRGLVRASLSSKLHD